MVEAETAEVFHLGCVGSNDLMLYHAATVRWTELGFIGLWTE